MRRRPGLSARLKLALSYAGFLAVAGALLLTVVWVFLLRYVPDNSRGLLGVSPNRYLLVHTFAPAAAVAMVFLLVFGLLGGWILAGRMLAPLTQIRDAARLAGNASLSHRIRMKGRHDEFRELSDAFDSMLDQLESHVAEQQRFAANASHELRTPLAISRTLLDVARKDPTRDRGELIERLHVVNTRAIDLTEALLLLSRGDRGTFTRESVDLSLLAEEAAETLLPLAEQRRITLDVTGGAAPTHGSAELLLRMVTNLVQNAVLHNLADGGSVTVHTETHGHTSVLWVENTGRRLPPELVPTLTEPFRRGTERVRTDEYAGVGLGLAIVHSVVRAHDGTLDLVPRPAAVSSSRSGCPARRSRHPVAGPTESSTPGSVRARPTCGSDRSVAFAGSARVSSTASRAPRLKHRVSGAFTGSRRYTPAPTTLPAIASGVGSTAYERR